MNKLTFHLLFVVVLTSSLINSPVLSVNAQAADEEKFKPEGKADAEQLIQDAQDALAFTVKAARDAGKELDPSNPDNKPFYSSLKRVDRALSKAQSDLAAKDPHFVHAIDSARAAVEEMAPTWELTKSKNKDVIEGARLLNGAVVALQENYNPLVEQKEKGGELTAEEKADYEKLKTQARGLVGKLEKLAAENKNDPALDELLKKVRVQVHHIEKAPETVASYSDSLEELAALAGELRAADDYLTPEERTKWKSISHYTTSFNDGYAKYAPAYTYDWSYTSSSVPVYDSYSSVTSSVSSSEVSSESSYLEDTSFKMDEKDEEAVSEESDSLSASDEDDTEMDSDQEQADDDEDSSEMDDSDDSSADSDDGDDSGGDDMDSGDDGGGDDSDDGGGDDGGGDE